MISSRAARLSRPLVFVLAALMLGGCYTQLQTADRRTPVSDRDAPRYDGNRYESDEYDDYRKQPYYEERRYDEHGRYDSYGKYYNRYYGDSRGYGYEDFEDGYEEGYEDGYVDGRRRSVFAHSRYFGAAPAPYDPFVSGFSFGIGVPHFSLALRFGDVYGPRPYYARYYQPYYSRRYPGYGRYGYGGYYGYNEYSGYYGSYDDDDYEGRRYERRAPTLGRRSRVGRQDDGPLAGEVVFHEAG
ncbi:MAG: hypothetical protein BRD47_07405, partial [Bacteroidetes bacterium QS_8_68_28]